MFRTFLIAVQFMTVFRVRDDLGETSSDMARAVGFFPAVGLLLGGLTAGACWVFSLFFPPWVTGILTALALALFTQGLHLDGLADTADGLFSHRDREMKLVIMKDSTIGVFGALALIFILGLKVALLAELAGRPGTWPILLLFPVWGRLAASVTACLSIYARPEGGLGRPFINLAGKDELFLAGGISVLASIFLLGVPGIICALVTALAAVGGVGLWKKQIGGVTGDILGATIELGECLGLLTASAWL